MGSIGRAMSRVGKLGFEGARWGELPLFARSPFEGCYEPEAEIPPRLEVTDLQHPEHFHQRLVAFLMRQH